MSDVFFFFLGPSSLESHSLFVLTLCLIRKVSTSHPQLRSYLIGVAFADAAVRKKEKKREREGEKAMLTLKKKKKKSQKIVPCVDS